MPSVDPDQAIGREPSVLPKAAIADLVAYKPPLSPMGSKRVIKLNLNEGALGPSPKAMAAMTTVAATMHRYPPVEASGLIQAIAERHGVDAQRIVVGCGSDELIQTLCLAFLEPGDEAIHTQYGFLLFPLAIKVAGGVPVSAPDDGYTASVDAILAAVTERTKLVFLANPNNPTGTYVSSDEVRRLRANLPSRVLLVLDAAYAEYVQRKDYTAGIELVEETDNTVMLRTFSKMYGMAGLRLGWAYCPKPIADVLYSIKPPYGVNYPALAAGIAALRDTEFYDRSLAHNTRWMPWLQEAFRKLGLTPQPTVANFMVLTFPDTPGKTAKEARLFLASRDILVRDLASYGIPDAVRLSVGTVEENRALVDALRVFMTRNARDGDSV
ncbi:MAG: histidinol-phosphate transaminase [Alphaproteobacteria bacterium]|nr:histidinol-phosphate transaminase [Alphaproteobacteria bacterium]